MQILCKVHYWDCGEETCWDVGAAPPPHPAQILHPSHCLPNPRALLGQTLLLCDLQWISPHQQLEL